MRVELGSGRESLFTSWTCIRKIFVTCCHLAFVIIGFIIYLLFPSLTSCHSFVVITFLEDPFPDSGRCFNSGFVVAFKCIFAAAFVLVDFALLFPVCHVVSLRREPRVTEADNVPFILDHIWVHLFGMVEVMSSEKVMNLVDHQCHYVTRIAIPVGKRNIRAKLTLLLLGQTATGIEFVLFQFMPRLVKCTAILAWQPKIFDFIGVLLADVIVDVGTTRRCVRAIVTCQLFLFHPPDVSKL